MGTGESLLNIGISVAAAGLILGMMAVSWLGFSFSLALKEIVGNHFFLLLLLAATGVTVIGIGMPALAAYVPVTLLVSRALSEVGMIPLGASMMVFCIAVLSFLIPPLCLAACTAALLANTGPMQTALKAWRPVIAAYIFPFVFSFTPSLLFIGPLSKVLTAVTKTPSGTHVFLDTTWIYQKFGYVPE